MLDNSRLKLKRIGNSSKRDPSDCENPRNPVDYENTRYDCFIKPFDEVKWNRQTISSLEDINKIHWESVQFEKSNIIVEGEDASSKILNYLIV